MTDHDLAVSALRSMSPLIAQQERALGAALERVRALETQLEAAFTQLEAARLRLVLAHRDNRALRMLVAAVTCPLEMETTRR